MTFRNRRDFVSVDDVFTTFDEVTKKQREQANKESRKQRFARAYPDVAMRRAIAMAAKEGVTGLVWSVFGDHDSTVRIENGDGEFLADVVDQLLDTLKPQERFVLEHRYHFNGAPPMTYKAIGLICPRLREWDYEKKRAAAIIKYEDAVLGLSNTRVQQIEWKALRVLRHPSRSQRLKKFLITRTEVSVP